MKKLLLSFILTNLVLTSTAQIFQLSGKVYEDNNKPVEFAEVLLVQNDSIFQYQLTDGNGDFIMNAAKGIYALYVRQFGDTLYRKTINLNQKFDLDIIIEQKAKKLQEVVITARKKLIERKTDRLVFHVENSISSTGGTALDVLKITPRIFVQKDQISMIGKSTMIVTINDKHLQISGDDLTNYLKSIPSETIESIEVISNPPAKYEAEGNSGIVNIRLKTPKTNAWNASFTSSYKQSTYGEGSLGGRFTYQKKNLTVLSNISYRNGSDGPLEKQTIHYPNQTFHAENDKRMFYDGFSGRLGIDYRLNKKFTLGSQYSGSFAKPDTKSNNIGTLTDLNNMLLQTQKTDMKKQLKNNYNTLNLHAIYNIDDLGRKLSLDADYFNYGQNQKQLYAANIYDTNNELIAGSYSSQNNIGQQTINNYSVKIDMLHPVEELKLNYGGKISFITTNNNLEFYDLSAGTPVQDISQSNEFRYTENNQSLYLSAEKNFNEKWDLQLGLRLENTQTNGNSLTLNEQHDNNYAKLFPTAYLTYTPNDNHSFSLNYGKRIRRPRFSMLNPFRTYLSPYQSVEGNPFLEPSSTHNIELGYTFMSNFNVSLFYSKESNGYSQVTIVESNTIQQTTKMLNYYAMNNYGADISYTFNKFKWMESYIQGDVSYSETNADHPSIQKKTEGWDANISASNSFIFNTEKTFLGNFDLYYSFPNTYINQKHKASLSAHIGFRYLMNKNLTLSLSLKDIFKTNTQQWCETINGIPINYFNYSDVRSIILSVSWRFGNNKINSRDPKTGNTEEKGRAN